MAPYSYNLQICTTASFKWKNVPQVLESCSKSFLQLKSVQHSLLMISSWHGGDAESHTDFFDFQLYKSHDLPEGAQ